MSEQQSAYSAKHGKIIAVLENDTFVYDVAANTWSKVATDERIYGHNAHSVVGYDPRADVFLLAFAPGGKGKEMKLAAFLDSEASSPGFHEIACFCSHAQGPGANELLPESSTASPRNAPT